MDLDDTTKRQRLVSGDCVRSKNVGRVMPCSTTSRLLKEHLRVEQPYRQANMALDLARISRDPQARAFRSCRGLLSPYETEKYTTQLVDLAKEA
jgi:hypothetical protein